MQELSTKVGISSVSMLIIIYSPFEVNQLQCCLETLTLPSENVELI